MRTRDRAPPLPRPCIALPRAAPRRAARGRQERGKKRKKNATENEREMLMRRACARTLSPRSFLLLEHRVQPTQPALRTGLMAPAWRLLHVSRRLILDLTCNREGSRFVKCPWRVTCVWNSNAMCYFARWFYVLFLPFSSLWYFQ